MRSRKATFLILIALIFAVALLLRLWGIDFGLPYEFHADEEQYVRQAASMGVRGLQPTWWNNPPFYKYLYFVEFGALYAAGKAAGVYASAAEFGDQLTFDPTLLYTLARATTAVLGAVTVIVQALAGAVAFNRRVGLIAAGFLAVAFIHVRDSHFATNDVPSTLAITTALLFAMLIVRSGRSKADSRNGRWYVFAGLAVGIGFATKYTAVLAVVAVLVAHALSPQLRQAPNRFRASVKPLALFGGAMLGAAVVASPYFVFAPGAVVSDIYEALYNAGQEGFDGWVIDDAGGYLFYLKSLWWGIGWPLCGLSLGGLVLALWRREPAMLVLGSFVLFTYLFFGRQEMYFARFILPIVPPLLLLAAVVVDNVAARIGSQRKRITMVAAGLALAASLLPLARAIQFDYLLTQTDTRTLARDWIEANIPGNSKIAVEWPFYSPPLSTADAPLPDTTRVYDVLQVGDKGLSGHALDWYIEQGFQYLVTSSHVYNVPLANEGHDLRRRTFYRELEERLEPAVVIQPFKGTVPTPFVFDELYGPAVSVFARERPGPVLAIYRLPEN